MWHFSLCVKDKTAKAVWREACHTFPSLEYDSQSWCTISNLQLYSRPACHILRYQGFAGIRDNPLSRIHPLVGWWKVESSMLERRKACWCAPFEVDCLAYLSQALMRTRSPLIENSYKFPIVRNCGQWREDILVIPCATSITQKLPLEVFAVPPFDVKGPSRVP